MGSEISITAQEIDREGLIDALRVELGGRADVALRIEVIEHDGPIDCLWGCRLSGRSEEIWQEAHDEADNGEGTIETIAPDDGSEPFDAIVFNGPYRERVLTAMHANGSHLFPYTTSFTVIEVEIGSAMIQLGIDHTTNSLGLPKRANGVDRIWTSAGWQGRDHEATAADHMAICEVVDILGRHATIEVADNTGFYVHRDETLLVAAMAAERELRADLRAAFAAMTNRDHRPAAPEPVLTIARLLGD